MTKQLKDQKQQNPFSLFSLQRTYFTDEPFLLVTLYVAPSAGVSKRCHVNTVGGIAPVLGFTGIPVCVFGWAVVRPEKGSLQVDVIKSNPEVGLLFKEHCSQKRLLIPVERK